jgi:hypothetical protein
MAALVALAFTWWWRELRPGYFLPKPEFLAEEFRSGEKAGAFRSWANKIWSQRGTVNYRDEDLEYVLGQYRIYKVGVIRVEAPPEFLCRKAWSFPRDACWIVDEKRQIIGVALSWGNMRVGLLIFPDGRPPAFRIEDGFESPAADIIVVRTIS